MKQSLVIATVIFMTPLSVQANILNSSHTLCNAVAYTPQEDVVYRPDPNVVPADINAAPLSLGDVTIPLNAYLADRLNIDTPVTGSSLGDIVIKDGGAVIFNGQDITSQVTVLCQKEEQINVADQKNQNKTAPVKNAPAKPQNVDGQVRVETVKSESLEPKITTEEKPLFGGYGQDHINADYND